MKIDAQQVYHFAELVPTESEDGGAIGKMDSHSTVHRIMKFSHSAL